MRLVIVGGIKHSYMNCKNPYSNPTVNTFITLTTYCVILHQMINTGIFK